MTPRRWVDIDRAEVPAPELRQSPGRPRVRLALYALARLVRDATLAVAIRKGRGLKPRDIVAEVGRGIVLGRFQPLPTADLRAELDRGLRAAGLDPKSPAVRHASARWVAEYLASRSLPETAGMV